MEKRIVRGKLRWVKESSDNKKIKNATRVEEDGIQFRSKLEAYCYGALKRAGLEPKYEFEKFTLLEGFEFNGEKIRPMTYTPDFILETAIIECKGFANQSFPIKAKLFKKHLKEKSINKDYYILKNQKEINECISLILEKNDNRGLQRV